MGKAISRGFQKYFAALVLTGVAVPILATALAAVLYILGSPQILPISNNPLFWGPVLILVIWLIASIPISTLATPENSNSYSYGLLKNELSQLEIYIPFTPPAAAPAAAAPPAAAAAAAAPPPSSPSQAAALAEMEKCWCDIEKEIKTVGLQWMLFTGYATVWTIMRRMQEAFMEYGSPDAVLREALGDMLRIKDSHMPKEDSLLTILGQAINVLNPSVMPLFIDAPSPKPLSGLPAQINVNPTSLNFGTLQQNISKTQPLQISNNGDQPLIWYAEKGNATHVSLDMSAGTIQPHTQQTIRVTLDTTGIAEGSYSENLTLSSNGGTLQVEINSVISLAAPGTSPVVAAPLLSFPQPLAKVQAQGALRQVRNALNQYRNDRWDGLIRSRNLLLLSMTITGLVTYLILAIAIVNKAPVSTVLAAVTFYAVGAIAGLFGWIYRGVKSDTLIDDYGLTQARLIATPLLSGLAGVGSVLITVILYGSLLLQPNPTTTSPPATPTMSIQTPTITSVATQALARPLSKTILSSSVQETASPTTSGTATTSSSTNTGQVLCTTIGPSTPTAQCSSLNDLFILDPRYLIAAAVFGLVPSLIIGTILQRSQQYVSDLNSVKPSEQGVY